MKAPSTAAFQEILVFTIIKDPVRWEDIRGRTTSTIRDLLDLPIPPLWSTIVLFSPNLSHNFLHPI